MEALYVGLGEHTRDAWLPDAYVQFAAAGALALAAVRRRKKEIGMKNEK